MRMYSRKMNDYENMMLVIAVDNHDPAIPSPSIYINTKKND